MTNPIHDPPEPWRLRLTEGELLEVRPAPTAGTQPQIVVVLPPWRAWDLSTTLHRYNRIAAIFEESSDTMTEESLARALNDARAAAVGPPESLPPASKVSPAERGEAMVILQRGRPELDHEQLVAVVDAAAWWLDTDEYNRASDLLQASAPDEVAAHALRVLIGWKPPTERPRNDQQ